MKKNKIVIAVGGTGGHVYPAIAVAEELLNRDPGLDIQFVGGGLADNPFFKGTSFPFTNVNCGTITWKKPFSAVLNAWNLAKGIAESYKWIIKNKPGLVIGFGSHHSLPVLLAAKFAKTSYILHEQNSILGRVNRLLSNRAEFTGYFFPRVQEQIKGRAIDVGMPLRQKYCKGNLIKEEARKYFGMDTVKPIILIFGGSQGARRLNQEFSKKIETASHKDFAVIHITGSQKMAEELKHHYFHHQITACVKEFEQRMDLAWQAAVLLIARSGAGTVAEQLEFEVPGILVPYPFAKDNHQEYNADFMVSTVKGAIKIPEKDFGKRNILAEALEMNLNKMNQEIIKYKEVSKKQDFCSLILEFLRSKDF